MTEPTLKEKRLRKADGYYNPATKEIELDSRLTGKRRLEILNHEYFHHLFPDMSEDEVSKKSKRLTNFQWKNRVRIVDEV